MTGIYTGHHYARGPEQYQKHGDNGVARQGNAPARANTERGSQKLSQLQNTYGHKKHGAEHARGAQLFHRAALQGFEHRFAPTLSISQSASFYTTDPGEARDAAQSLLQAANTLLAQAGGDTEAVASGIQDSLIEARNEAGALASSDAQAHGVAETAALVDKGLQDAAAEGTTVAGTDDLVALKAARQADYSLQIRTQEGDLVRISLRTSEYLAISEGADGTSGTDTEASSGQEIVLSANANLKLLVFGDLNDSELEAIRGVFDQAADVAQEFFDGDLAAALDSAQTIEFNDAQIAKVNLNFRAHTFVSATYAPGQSAPVPAPEPEDPPATESAPAQIEASVDSGNEALAAPLESGDDTVAAPVESDDDTVGVAAPEADAAQSVETGPADTTSGNGLDGFADSIAAYFRTYIAGLESLQAGTSDDETASQRLVSAFKLDVLKVTLIASADETQGDAAEQAAAATEDAATADAL